MNNFLGIDTSNYTTSVAVVSEDNTVLSSKRKLLEVSDGQVGLRQSEAVFKHIKNLPDIVSEAVELCEKDCIKAVGVSDRPRNKEGSYMPCFMAGKAVAESIASVLKVPCFRFSHQSGHIAAALLSAGKLDLIGGKFIAFHISGGTTEAILVTADEKDFFDCEIIGESSDLKIGQAVDRVGNMLGLPFPSGKYLEELALTGNLPISAKPTVRDCNCSISGLQNKCEDLYKKGLSKNDIARFCIEYICNTVDKMTENIILKYGDLPLIYAGGVMSNSFVKEKITKKYGAYFAAPEFSTDNASGIALMTKLKY